LQLGLKPTSRGLEHVLLSKNRSERPDEVPANNLAAGFKLETRKAEPVRSLLRRLREKGAITAEQVDLAPCVLNICNRAIHGQSVTREEALDVIEAASVVAPDFWSGLAGV